MEALCTKCFLKLPEDKGVALKLRLRKNRQTFARYTGVKAPQVEEVACAKAYRYENMLCLGHFKKFNMALTIKYGARGVEVTNKVRHIISKNPRAFIPNET